ncbi:MAG: glycoside hydrolase family 3 C-terminal domain-containing protein, partial [Anaerolineae bacterium]|nr:glycoside hydrolase family 3 C-terminal domain-containing protein [Anaerolineae bacterium]
IAEGGGEDPFLGAVLARARVRGFQAKGLAGDKRIVACPKHYVAYGAAEAGKDYNTVDISERTLRDVYLPPFKAAFDEGAGSVMSSFNEISGVPASANAFILRTVLRDEWQWPGVVLSDFDALGELIHHGVAANFKEAALRAILAGEDIDMMGYAFYQHLAALIREGQVPEALIDEAVRRILRLKVALGIFEHPYTDETLASQVILREDSRTLALEVAQKSIVLLKNEGGVLPLSPAFKKVALIGPLADNQAELLGCWACQGRAGDVETVLDGARAVLAGTDIELTYSRGCAIEGDEELDIGAATTLAMQADAVVLVLGESAMMSGEAHSRAYLGLPGHQQALFEAVVAMCAETGIPIIVVLMSGRPLVIPDLVTRAQVVVQAWHGGIRAGRAVADVLFGIINPSGKLTVSFPRTEGQIPIYYAHKSTGRPVTGRGVIQFDRRHRSEFLDLPPSPQFGFGYGLSYTTFAYSDLVVETPEVRLTGTVSVSVTVTNTGERAGDEIVQLYVQDVVGQVTRPVKELKGFKRISLEPGESQRLIFEVPVQSLGFHDLDMIYVVEPGDFKVWIGPNAQEGLEGAFVVVAAE